MTFLNIFATTPQLKIVAALLIALALAACEPKTVATAPPEFTKPEHVSRCLPALIHFDQLAQHYGGSQLGARIEHAPWLRIQRFDQYILNDMALDEKTLGAALVPMQYSALAALRIERQAIPLAEQQAWQAQFNIENIDHFLGYCSGETVFAQLRDSDNTLTWLAQLNHHFENDNISTTALPNSPVAIKNNLSEFSPWHSYILETMPAQPVRFTKNTLDLPLLGPSNEQELLRRYAPSFNLSHQQSTLKPSTLAWQNSLIQTTSETSVYAYADLGFWRGETLFRLHYVVWLAEENSSASKNAFIVRLSIHKNGKVLAFETMQLDGGDYRLYTGKNTQLTTSPKGLSHTAKVLAPKMAIFLAEKPLRILDVARLSGMSNTQTFSLKRFDSLYELPTATAKKSIFDKNNHLAQATLGLGKINALLNMKTNRGRALGYHRIHKDSPLYFDDPALLDKLGLSTQIDSRP